MFWWEHLQHKRSKQTVFETTITLREKNRIHWSYQWNCKQIQIQTFHVAPKVHSKLGARMHLHRKVLSAGEPFTQFYISFIQLTYLLTDKITQVCKYTYTPGWRHLYLWGSWNVDDGDLVQNQNAWKAEPLRSRDGQTETRSLLCQQMHSHWDV